MSKVLQLSKKVGSYVSTITENTNILSEQIIRVDDKTAEYLMKQTEMDKGDNVEPIFHELDGDEDTVVHYDIVAMKAQRLAEEREARGLVPAPSHSTQMAQVNTPRAPAIPAEVTAVPARRTTVPRKSPVPA